MNEQQTLKVRMIRYIVYFLGSILICTILSRSIYDYLLPVVSTTSVAKGSVEVKQCTTGKIGLDETQLKQKKVTVVNDISGKIVELYKGEGDYIKQGEVLGKIQKEADQQVLYDQAVEQMQLQQAMQQANREKAYTQEEIKSLQDQCKQKQEKLIHIEEDYKIVNLKEAIKEQEKLIETNKTLNEVGALSDKEQTDSQLKLEQLNRDLEEARQNLKESIEETIRTDEEKIATLQENLLKLDETYRLSAKKMEKGNLDKLEQNLVSPITGYIQTINAYKGAYVGENEKLIVIIPEGIDYRLSFELQEEAADKVAVGQKANFKWAQRPYEATVIKKSFNETTGNMVIECELTNDILEKMNLDYGSYRTVNVEITKTSEEYPSTIYNGALQQEDGTGYVYAVEKKEQLGRTAYILRKISVSVLEGGDFKTAISGNVGEDMKFVKGDLSQLKDGQEVKLK